MVDREAELKKMATINMMMKKDFNEMFTDLDPKEEEDRKIVGDASDVELRRKVMNKLI